MPNLNSIRGIIQSLSRGNVAGSSPEDYYKTRNTQRVNMAEANLAARAAASGVSPQEIQQREADAVAQQGLVAAQDRRLALEEQRSKQTYRGRLGQESLLRGQAALAKARGGGTRVSSEALKLLGLPDEFTGKVSPITARTAATLKERRAGLKGQEETRKLASKKAIAKQRQDNRKFNQNRDREARLATQAQLAAIDKQLGDVDPESVTKTKELFKTLMSEAGGNAFPENQIETYLAAARSSLPPGADEEEIKAEATRMAEEDGYEFLPAE